MKFKYALGERVLFKKTINDATTEQVGQITMIKTETTKDGVNVWYGVNESWIITDSDILARITLLKAPVTRTRKKRTAPIQTEIPMTNGKIGYMGDVNGAGSDPSTV